MGLAPVFCSVAKKSKKFKKFLSGFGVLNWLVYRGEERNFLIYPGNGGEMK